MKITDTHVYFWNGPFSNWYPCKFNVGEIEYNCSEQYMMAEKARTFFDIRCEQAIMASDNPKQQKWFGRQIKNFDIDKWNRICQNIVFDGCYAKFDQDNELKKFILSTGDKILVEASPYDKIWGVGLAEDDPKILDENQWIGTNWLGEVLMRVRKKLFDKDAINVLGGKINGKR